MRVPAGKTSAYLIGKTSGLLKFRNVELMTSDVLVHAELQGELLKIRALSSKLLSSRPPEISPPEQIPISPGRSEVFRDAHCKRVGEPGGAPSGIALLKTPSDDTLKTPSFEGFCRHRARQQACHWAHHRATPPGNDARQCHRAMPRGNAAGQPPANATGQRHRSTPMDATGLVSRHHSQAKQNTKHPQ